MSKYVKIKSEDSDIYVNLDKLLFYETYCEKGFETDTMKRVTNYHIDLYLDSNLVINIDTYSKKDYEHNMKILNEEGDKHD